MFSRWQPGRGQASMSSSAGTRATAGRPSASCLPLQWGCQERFSFLLFLTQGGRSNTIQKRDYTVPKQWGRVCALTFVRCPGDGQGDAANRELSRGDFSYHRRVTGEPTLPQWVTSQGQQVTRAQGFPLRPNLSFKRRRKHVRHKSW